MSRIQITVRRTDTPEDPPDTLDEHALRWDVYSLAAALRGRYGPTVEADVAIDGKAWRVTGTAIVLKQEAPCPE